MGTSLQLRLCGELLQGSQGCYISTCICGTGFGVPQAFPSLGISPSSGQGRLHGCWLLPARSGLFPSGEVSTVGPLFLIGWFSANPHLHPLASASPLDPRQPGLSQHPCFSPHVCRSENTVSSRFADVKTRAYHRMWVATQLSERQG